MTEENKLLIISDNPNEFLVKSVTSRMNGMGYRVYTCNPVIDEVNEVGKGINVFLLFVDSAELIKELLIFLKDTAYDRRTEIGLVGERLDIQEAIKLLLKENVGATFPRPVDAKQICEGLESLKKIADQKGERKRILIIDDDPEYLRRTQNVLHNHYKIYVANSGVSGIKLLSKHKVDLILLDYVMPVLNGPKVLEALKADPELSEIPVVFLSGQTDVRSITTAMTLGSENYISKALAAKELAAVIADYFAKKDWKKMNG